MKYCINCGIKIKESDKFCEKCGCKNNASLTVEKIILPKTLRKKISQILKNEKGILLIVVIIIGIITLNVIVGKVSSMVGDYRQEKKLEKLDNERFPKIKDYSIYMSQEYISNPVYLQNKDNFLIDTSPSIQQSLFSRNEPRQGEAWVERILYYDEEKKYPNFLVSYTYEERGEEIISFYLHPVAMSSHSLSFLLGRRFAAPLYLGADYYDYCSLKVLKDMLERIFVKKYVRIDSVEDGMYWIVDDIFLRKQDVSNTLLKGVKVDECKQERLHKLKCGVDVYDKVSGFDLLVTNGYASGRGADIAKLAEKGAWSICK